MVYSAKRKELTKMNLQSGGVSEECLCLCSTYADDDERGYFLVCYFFFYC